MFSISHVVFDACYDNMSMLFKVMTSISSLLPLKYFDTLKTDWLMNVNKQPITY